VADRSPDREGLAGRARERITERLAPKAPRTSKPGPPEEPPRRNLTIVWLLAGVAAILLFQGFFFGGASEIPFSRFLTLVDQERVVEAEISSSSVSGRFTSGEDTESFTTELPPEFSTNELVELLREKGVEVSGSQPSAFTNLLVSLLPFVLIAAFYYFFFIRRVRQQLGGGGPLSFGRNKAKLYDRTDMKTTFADVAGVDEVEAELVELVDYLKNPEKFERVGARIPKGVLLVGPPGTGKTLLARAIAGEAGVPFFYISASEFIELFVGLGAARVRDLFKQARERAPAIVFIDEIDSIGQTRSGAAGYQMGSNQEQEQTLQQLLTEMDGFEPNSGVIIVAASTARSRSTCLT